MGLEQHAVQFLLRSRGQGVDFSQMVTLGRQNFQTAKTTLRRIARQESLAIDDQELDAWISNQGRGDDAYSERFLQFLGAPEAAALDAHDYEGAGLIHDLNAPLPETLLERFSCVFDGGSLEHIFNFPVALWNCLRLVKPGGHFITACPADGYCGHGFFQFSPELWWTVLSARNGFVIESMIAAEVGGLRRWFEVPNPAEVGRRVHLSSFVPVITCVRARRIGPVPDSVQALQMNQSDYQQAWSAAAGEAAAPAISRLSHLKGAVLRWAARRGIPPVLVQPMARKLRRARP